MRYSANAMPINLRRSKFHSGTGFSPPYLVINCTYNPVEVKASIILQIKVRNYEWVGSLTA